MAIRKNAEKTEETAVAVEEAQNEVGAPANALTVDWKLSDEELRSLSNTEDVMALMAAKYGTVESITDSLGTGFRVMLEGEKSRLVGESIIILQFSFTMGDFGEFASAALFCPRTSDRLILNDGSTGIYYQLKELAKKRMGGWGVPHGLRVSEYDTCPPSKEDGGCGRPRRANVAQCPSCLNESEKRGKGSTYYLDTTE